MKRFVLAWQFLTILPSGKSGGEVEPRHLGPSMAYYPAVGFLLGLILWAAYGILSGIFPRAVADGLVLLLLVVMTGAFHLDGLADTLDGLAFGKTPAERLRIMKEHQIGTFGVVGLILVLGLKYAAFHSLPAEWAAKALIVALMLGRGSMAQVLYRSPYARTEGGLGLGFKKSLGKKHVLAAMACGLGVSFYFFRVRGILLWLVTGVFSLGVEIYFKRKIGGVTGDVLGATNEANEALTLLCLSALWHSGIGRGLPMV